MKLFGKYRGFVVDNNDPMKLRRLKVKVPALFGDEVLDWAWPCEPYGGLGEVSFVAVPPVGAGVWVEFEAGDPDSPIWSGCWSAAPGGTPEISSEADAKYPYNKVIKTESGHTLELDDTSGEEKIKLTCKDGTYLLIDAKSGQRRIEVYADTLKITLNRESQEIVLESTNAVKIQATEAVQIQASSAVEIQAPSIQLGSGGCQGVTTQAHPCLFLGAPHPGSGVVKASS